MTSGHPATLRAGSFAAIFASGRALSTILLWISSFFSLLGVYLLLNWLPTLLLESGLTKTQAAGSQVAFNIGGALSALMFGQLLEGPLRNASIGVTFLAAPLLVFALSRATYDPTVLMILAFALGCSILAAPAYLYGAAATAYPTAIRGVGTGATVAAGRLGSIAGPKLGGVLKAAGHSSVQLFADLLPLVIVGCVAALVLAWHAARGNRSQSASLK